MSYNNLNLLFTRTSFKNLLDGKKNVYTDRYIKAAKRFTKEDDVKNKIIIQEIYKYLEENHRNEYFFLNNLTNQVFIRENNIKTSTALTEQRVNKSKADYIIINKRADVYEVKTGLDTFSRIESQINDYFKAFKYVNVVVDYTNYKEALVNISNKNVGIYMLNKDNNLICVKKPNSVTEHLNHEVIFKMLWKEEYEAIIKEECGYLPDVSDFIYPIVCLDMIKEIDIETFQNLAINKMKKRIGYNKFLLKESIPYELKYLTYYIVNTEKMYNKLNSFLNSQLRDLIIC